MRIVGAEPGVIGRFRAWRVLLGSGPGGTNDWEKPESHSERAGLDEGAGPGVAG